MRRRLFWSGLIGSGRLLLDRVVVFALAARMPTRIRNSLGGAFRAVDGETVRTVAGFLKSWGNGAVGHSKILTWQNSGTMT